jgi:putative phage-type endonuclease
MTSEVSQEIDRSTYIGSADIASLYAVEGAFGSPYEVWARKRGIAPPIDMTEAMEVGLILEDYVLGRYEREESETVGAKQVFFRHPDYEFCGSTVDGLIMKDGQPVRIVEAKTTRDYKWDEVPLRYEAQVQWQMGVSGIHEADLTVLHRPDLQLKTYRIQFNPSIFSALLDRAVDFWMGFVQTGTEPDTDGLAATTEILKSIKADPGKTIEIDGLKDRLDALKAAKLMAKQAEEQVEAITNEIRAAMNDAEVGTIDGQTAVTWKTSTTSRLDTKRLKAEKPDVYEAFTTQSESRTFRISTNKGDK